MNTINTNNSILNATNYKQTNAATNTAINKVSLKPDSFVKSANSLVSEPYAKEDGKNVSQVKTVSAVPNIDLDSLTENELDKYFGYAIDENNKAVYLPIINASDDVKKAWIASIDKLGDVDASEILAPMGCNIFLNGCNSDTGLNLLPQEFLNIIKTTLDNNLTNKTTEPNEYGIIDGQREYALKLKEFYDIFEAFYKEYNK